MQLGVPSQGRKHECVERHVSSTDEDRVLSSATGGGFNRHGATVFGRRMLVAQKAGPGDADWRADYGSKFPVG
jgi:hypothetical protein